MKYQKIQYDIALTLFWLYRLETLKLGVNKKYFFCISHKENANGFSLFVPSHIFT